MMLCSSFSFHLCSLPIMHVSKYQSNKKKDKNRVFIYRSGVGVGYNRKALGLTTSSKYFFLLRIDPFKNLSNWAHQVLSRTLGLRQYRRPDRDIFVHLSLGKSLTHQRSQGEVSSLGGYPVQPRALVTPFPIFRPENHPGRNRERALFRDETFERRGHIFYT